jgi:hypothetical protein
MKFCLTAFFLTAVLAAVHAQNIAINNDGSSADTSAILDLKSTSRGFLAPRMTKTQRNAIFQPATGLLMYQTGPDSTGLHVYDGAQWSWVTASNNINANAWRLGGNSGTSPATNFIGTTDNNPLVFRTQNAEVMRVTGNGAVGIGATAPVSLLANTGGNTVGVDGVGVNDPSLSWAMNTGGYTAALYNSATGAGSNGLLVKIAGTGSLNRILDLSVGGTQTVAGTAVLVVNGTISPASTLQVDGTVAVGVSMNVAGGAIGSPVQLGASKSYVGLEPSGSNNYYELPAANTCPGRIYYIRNNANVNFAYVRAASPSLICPGSSACLNAGDYYELKVAASVKTIIAISDGTNWTVGRID